MIGTSSFSWFDLNKYDSVESFDIDDWFYQLDKRRVIHKFSKEIPETIERLGVSRWKNVNRIAMKRIASIKDNPILTYEKLKRRALSVRDASYFDLHLASYTNQSLANVFNLSEDEWGYEMGKTPIVSKPQKGSCFDRAMLTIDVGATDEQLMNDFSQWLKNHRTITKYKVREKRFTPKDFEKWISNKVLPYLDLTLIANAEDKQLTQNTVGRLLFPNEYNVDLTERIRRSVKPLAELLIDNKTLEALNYQASAA
jgi:hypothetical protein